MFAAAFVLAATAYVSPEVALSPVTPRAAAGSQSGLSMAGNLAVWSDSREGLFAQILDRGVTVRIDDQKAVAPSVAWDGDAYVIFAYDAKGELWSWLVDDDARPLREPVQLEKLQDARLRGDGGEIVATARDGSGAVIAYVDRHGRIGRKVLLGSDLSVPDVVADGDAWLGVTVGTSCTPVCGSDVHRLRLRGSGAVVERDRVLKTATGSASSRNATASNGAQQIFVWTDMLSVGSKRQISIAYAVVDRNGSVLAGPTVIDGNVVATADDDWSNARPAAGWDGANFVVLWSRSDDEHINELRGARIVANGTLVEGFVLSRVATLPRFFANDPVIDGTTMAWIQWSLVDNVAEGDVVTQQGPLVRSANPQMAPAIAWSGEAFCATWNEQMPHRGVMARVIPKKGNALAPIVVSAPSAMNTAAPAIAFADGTWAVAYREYDSPREFRVMLRRFDSRNRFLGAPQQIAPREPVTDERSRNVAIASDGKQFLVVWTGGDQRVKGVRVSTSGTVSDKTPKIYSDVTAGHRGDVRALWTGSEFFVMWEHEPGAGQTQVARSTRINASGEILDFGFTRFSIPAAFDIFWDGALHVTWIEKGCMKTQRFGLDGLEKEAPREVTCEAHALPGGVWNEGTLEATANAIAASGVSTPAGVYVVYERIDAASGYVPRVYLRRVVESNKRRSGGR